MQTIINNADLAAANVVTAAATTTINPYNLFFGAFCLSVHFWLYPSLYLCVIQATPFFHVSP